MLLERFPLPNLLHAWLSLLSPANGTTLRDGVTNTVDASYLPSPPASHDGSSQDASAQEDVAEIVAPSPLQSTLSLVPHMDREEDRILLTHYLNVTSQTLSRSDSGQPNPFLHCVLPLAMGNPTVMHSILALSGSQRQTTDPRASTAVLRHASQATKGLVDMLSHLDATSIVPALCCPR